MKTSIARLSLTFLYLITFMLIAFRILPWSNSFSLLEDFLLFIPRWLLFTPLVIAIISIRYQSKKQLLPLIVLGSILIYGYLPVEFSIAYFQPKAPEPLLRIMTVNVGGTDSPYLKRQISKSNVNVVAMQEASFSLAKNATPENWHLLCDNGNCLASSYPIEFVKGQDRRFLNGWGNISTLFKVSVNGRNLFIINAHLETPRKGFEDFSLKRFNIGALKENALNRYIEASVVEGLVKDKKYVLILGDFNMPIEHSIYRRFFQKYQNAFSTKGTGMGYTKYSHLTGVRIDHILADDSFSIVSASIGEDFGGDHLPMLASIAFSNNFSNVDKTK